MKKKPAKKSPAKKKTTPTAAIGAAMRELEKLMSSGDFIVQQDLDALLTSLHGPSPDDELSNAEADARADAQQLAFDAMEAESEAQAIKLAKRALKLDPDCVDALVVLAEIETDSPRQMIERLQKAVAAGERSLGARFIQENAGHFWGLIDTRPYMRAMAQLGRLLSAEGLNLDAIRVYERMLELNPNDNQGVRDPLLGTYLCVDDLEGAGKLLKRYKEDAGANFAWGRVLQRFLAGDPAGAVVALKKARQANHFVELYMTGKKPIPLDLPEMYQLGSEEEATTCMDGVGLAWSLHKDAVFWLLDLQVNRQLPEGRPAIPSKVALKRVPVKGKRMQ